MIKGKKIKYDIYEYIKIVVRIVVKDIEKLNVW